MEESDTQVSRRGFLRGVFAAVAAGTAVGAGGAVLQQKMRAGAVAPFSSAAVQPLLSPQALANCDRTTLLQQIVAVQADNVRLQSERDGLQRQVDLLLADGTTQDETVSALDEELQIARAEIGGLSGLVALYEQLDAWGVDEMFEEGIANFEKRLVNFNATIPSWEQSIVTIEKALTKVEAHIPLLQNGRLWLQRQLDKVEQYYQVAEQVLENAVDIAAPFLQMLNQWFQDVLKWLPFGMGSKAAAVMAALTDLIDETPHTMSGLETNLLQPLAAWLSAEDGELPLQRDLIKPVREQALAGLNDAAVQGNALATVFGAELKDPAHAVMGQRQLVRELIIKYRANHELQSNV